MTRDEHKNILGFIEKVVRPDSASQKRELDVEADAIIRALFVRNPEAAYRMTMLAMAQAEKLAALAAETSGSKPNFRQGWLSRLLKKQNSQSPHRRRAPRPPTLLVERT